MGFFPLCSFLSPVLVGGGNPRCQTSNRQPKFSSRSCPRHCLNTGFCLHPPQGWQELAWGLASGPVAKGGTMLLPALLTAQFCQGDLFVQPWLGQALSRRVAGLGFSPCQEALPQRTAELLEVSSAGRREKPLTSACSALRPGSSPVAATHPKRHLGGTGQPGDASHPRLCFVQFSCTPGLGDFCHRPKASAGLMPSQAE